VNFQGLLLNCSTASRHRLIGPLKRACGTGDKSALARVISGLCTASAEFRKEPDASYVWTCLASLVALAALFVTYDPVPGDDRHISASAPLVQILNEHRRVLQGMEPGETAVRALDRAIKNRTSGGPLPQPSSLFSPPRGMADREFLRGTSEADRRKLSRTPGPAPAPASGPVPSGEKEPGLLEPLFVEGEECAADGNLEGVITAFGLLVMFTGVPKGLEVGRWLAEAGEGGPAILGALSRYALSVADSPVGKAFLKRTMANDFAALEIATQALTFYAGQAPSPTTCKGMVQAVKLVRYSGIGVTGRVAYLTRMLVLCLACCQIVAYHCHLFSDPGSGVNTVLRSVGAPVALERSLRITLAWDLGPGIARLVRTVIHDTVGLLMVLAHEEEDARDLYEAGALETAVQVGQSSQPHRGPATPEAHTPYRSPQLFVTTSWSNLEVIDSAMELLLALLTRGARRGSALRPPPALTDPAVDAKLASHPDDFGHDGHDGQGISAGTITLICLRLLVKGAAGGTREWAKALKHVDTFPAARVFSPEDKAALAPPADGEISCKVSGSHALCDDKDTAVIS
jgi:hypothetical protein